MEKEAARGDVRARGLWSSRLMFILAAAGSAIGLGNVWKFPYLCGKYGGGAFVLLYLVCIVLIGIPLLVAEIVIGRAARRNPVGAFRVLGKGRRGWLLVGFLGVASGFVILSYYSVVAGWTLAYLTKSFEGAYLGVDTGGMEALFGRMLGNPWEQAAWHTVFIAMTVGIVIFGIREGLERWIGILMPLLFLILILLVFYGLWSGEARAGLSYLFVPRWENLVRDSLGNFTARAVLEAAGQAFFTLSLGMGAMITYGSYLGDDENIPTSAAMIAGLDTMIALLAGIAIFTILFHFNLDPSAAGPGLVFKILPLAFAQMPGGQFIGIAFFVLLAFAALTSAISLLEVVVAYFIDERKWSRRSATLIMAGVIWALGLLSAFSYNLLVRVRFPLLVDKEGQGMAFLDAFDLLATNYMLPIGGFFIALFAGWFMEQRVVRREMLEGGASERFYRFWRPLIRVISPAAVLLLIGFMLNSDFRTSTGSALCDAARRGKLERVKKLLAQDPSRIQERSRNGFTPLHYAARYSHVEIVRFLLTHGAEADLLAEKSRTTPLHLAAQSGSGAEVVSLLLGHGAKANNREALAEDGVSERTALHYAVDRGDEKAVNLLLEAGAEVNAADSQGWTPLHYAANRGYLSMVNLLLGKGAEVNARNKAGQTPLGLPTIKPHKLVAQKLKEAGGQE